MSSVSAMCGWPFFWRREPSANATLMRQVAYPTFLRSELLTRRYYDPFEHLEVEIMAKNRSTVVCSIPFKRFSKGNHVKPRPAFNLKFIVRHIRSFPIAVSPSHRQTLPRTRPAVVALALSGVVPPVSQNLVTYQYQTVGFGKTGQN